MKKSYRVNYYEGAVCLSIKRWYCKAGDAAEALREFDKKIGDFFTHVISIEPIT